MYAHANVTKMLFVIDLKRGDKYFRVGTLLNYFFPFFINKFSIALDMVIIIVFAFS